jgi:hypothetical protein
MPCTRRFVAIAIVSSAIALGSVHAAGAQASAAPEAPPVDLSGLWLVQDPGPGSWMEWFFNAASLPKPELQQAIIAENKILAELERSGEVVNRTPRRLDCPSGSVAMMMASSSPLMIVQGGTELLMGPEVGRGRTIALDGRQLPNTWARGFVPIGAGYSVGRWEGNVLVVDTVGFPTDVCDSRRPGGAAAPGWGRVRSSTRLTERYELKGDVLAVTFTWDDPTVYVKPYTYTYEFKKVPGEPVEN